MHKYKQRDKCKYYVIHVKYFLMVSPAHIVTFSYMQLYMCNTEMSDPDMETWSHHAMGTNKSKPTKGVDLDLIVGVGLSYITLPKMCNSIKVHLHVAKRQYSSNLGYMVAPSWAVAPVCSSYVIVSENSFPITYSRRILAPRLFRRTRELRRCWFSLLANLFLRWHDQLYEQVADI